MTLENNYYLKASQRETGTSDDLKNSAVSTVVTSLFWLLFVSNFMYLIFNFTDMPQWTLGNVLRINGFTILIWTTVTFFSAVVSSYASNYLKGFRFNSRFMMLCLGFTLIGNAPGYVESYYAFIIQLVNYGIFYVQIDWCRHDLG